MYQSPSQKSRHAVFVSVCLGVGVSVCASLCSVQTGRDLTPKGGGSAVRRTDGLPHGG